MRNLTATLLLSSGVPMVTAGDERGKTQLGNNNAYCQDSALSWVNWEPTRTQRDLETTFSYLTSLRKNNPALRPAKFGSFEERTLEKDRLRWFNDSGELMGNEDWQNPECRTVLRFSEHESETGELNRMLLVIHGSETETEVQLPLGLGVDAYELLWNSALDLPPKELVQLEPEAKLPVSGTSMLLLRVIETR